MGLIPDSMTIEIQFDDARSGYSVIFDDDGRAAYAYLRDSTGKIVGDVWVYNRCQAPAEPEWHDVENLPCANAAAFTKPHLDFGPVEKVSELTIEWDDTPRKQVRARLFKNDLLIAILAEGVMPGWSSMAKKNGPLARVLKDF